jgi:hypothetical protein
VEPELRADEREGALQRRDVAIARVPRQDDVNVAEEACADHVDLAIAAFLGRRAVIADGARDLRRLERVLDRDGRQRRAASQQVVAAAMAVTAGDARLLHRFCLLRQPWQRVELTHDADHRLAAAPLGDERRRHVGHPLPDTEPRLPQFLHEQARALRLLEPRLGKLPDLARHVAEVPGMRLHSRENGGRGRRTGLTGQSGDRDYETEGNGRTRGHPGLRLGRTGVH